ncbi:hypothetical protein GCM10027093_49480 [Paraburkholderia jirisanensis]
MVPHIPVIAMTVAEPLPATSSFDAAMTSMGTSSGMPAYYGPPEANPTAAETRRARFDDSRASATLGWLETLETDRNAAAADLDAQIRRAASGKKLQVADALRLRHDLNTHLETLMLYKKVADTMTTGLQTLARGN